jgi:hypothetical protein
VRNKGISSTAAHKNARHCKDMRKREREKET